MLTLAREGADALEALHVGLQVAFWGVDDDRADRRHHVAREHRSITGFEEAEVALVMAGGVDRGQVPAIAAVRREA